MDVDARFAAAVAALDLDAEPLPRADPVIAEIRRSLSLRETNLILRAVASRPELLEQLWSAVEPAVSDGRLPAVAADLILVQADTMPDAPEPLQLLTSQHPITARLLVLSRAWRHAMVEDPEDQPIPLPAPRSPGGKGPADDVARQLGLPLVPTIFRRIEPWPAALEVVREARSGPTARAGLATDVRELTQRVDAAVAQWPWPPADAEPIRPGWPLARVVTGFADWFIPTVHAVVGRTVATWPPT